MKILNSIIAILLFFIVGFGQDRSAGAASQTYNANLSGGVFRGTNYAKAKPVGSPYLNPIFSIVKVETINQNAKMRHNVFSDEFEFISPINDTLILDKIEVFNSLNFVATNTKYKLLNYLNLDNKYQFGYLISIYEKGNCGLFKKENITLTDEKIAKTTLEQNMPAKYYQADNTYFLKYADKIQEFPSNKKRLSKIFPDKKEAIETFVKENKIDFDKEIDKIKIIDFLITL